MKKIIHLSDLHIGHDDCGVKFRQIVENITLFKQPADNYVIVITGDLVDNATHEAQVEEALDAIDQLEKRGYKVLVVPGNHDYGTGCWANEKYVKSFKKYFYKDSKIQYPKVDVIDEAVFIGLDSIADELHWYDKMLSEGEIGEAQLKRLRNIIEDPQYSAKKKIVYLHHHPIDVAFGMQLKDRDKLGKILKNKVQVLLFGHFHDDSNCAGKIYNGTWGIERVYNAGSSTHKNGNTGLHRVINLEKETRDDYDAKFI
jgi:3',5'-cyclic AMP phosphodiesterase CpdA